MVHIGRYTHFVFVCISVFINFCDIIYVKKSVRNEQIVYFQVSVLKKKEGNILQSKQSDHSDMCTNIFSTIMIGS